MNQYTDPHPDDEWDDHPIDKRTITRKQRHKVKHMLTRWDSIDHDTAWD